MVLVAHGCVSVALNPEVRGISFQVLALSSYSKDKCGLVCANVYSTKREKLAG